MKRGFLKAFLQNAVLALASFALAAAALEAGLRLLAPQVLDLDLRKWVVADPEVHHRFKPGLDVRVSQPDYGPPMEFRFFTDERGLRRGDGPRPLVQDGAFHVLWLGDSQTWGWGVNYEESYPSLAAAALEGRVGRCHSVNAAVCGYGPDITYLLLEKLRPDARAHVGVLGFYVGNDFADVTANTIFSVENGELRRNPRFRTFEEEMAEKLPGDWKGRAKHFVNTRSHAVRFFAERTRALRWKFFPPEWLNAPPPGIAAAEIYYSPPPPHVVKERETTGLLLREIRDALREEWNAPLAVVILPGREPVQNEKISPPPAGVVLELDAPHRFLREWCAAEGVLCVDVVEPLREAERERENAVFFMDGHYTQLAHRLIAERVSQAILDAPGLLDAK